MVGAIYHHYYLTRYCQLCLNNQALGQLRCPLFAASPSAADPVVGPRSQPSKPITMLVGSGCGCGHQSAQKVPIASSGRSSGPGSSSTGPHGGGRRGGRRRARHSASPRASVLGLLLVSPWLSAARVSRPLGFSSASPLPPSPDSSRSALDCLRHKASTVPSHPGEPSASRCVAYQGWGLGWAVPVMINTVQRRYIEPKIMKRLELLRTHAPTLP